jgi:putative FmdB family regulatory protein
MPLYEYECGACGHRFERIQRFSDAPVQDCPKCGGAPVHKLLSAPAIHFKGTGWYITDYGSRKNERAESAASNGDSSAKPGSSSSPESSAKSDSSKPESSSSAGETTASGKSADSSAPTPGSASTPSKSDG